MIRCAGAKYGSIVALASVRKESLDPFVSSALDSIVLELFDKALVTHLIEGFTKIHYTDICLSTILHVVYYVTREFQ